MIYASLLAVPIAVLIGALNVTSGQPIVGIIDIAVGGVLIILAYLTYVYKKFYKISRYAVIAIAWGLFLSLLITGGYQGTGIYWSVVFPVFTLLLLDSPRAFYVNTLFGISLLTGLLASRLGWIEISYTTVEVAQVVALLQLVYGFVYIFYRQIKNWATTAELNSQELKENATEVEQQARMLQEQTKELSENKAELEKTKSAMLNLLEDLQEKSAKMTTLNRLDEALIGSIGESILVTDEYGKISRANNRAEELTGRKTKELIGQWLPKVLNMKTTDGEDIAPEESVIVEAISTGKAIERSYRLYLDKDDFITIQMVASPFLLDGKPRGLVAVIRDISEQFEVDKAKTEFVSLASHQLRTPLSAIGWYTEMLINGDMGKLNKEQQENLEQVYKSNQRMVALVDSLLNVSRVELGTFAFDPVETDMSEIVDQVLGELKPQVTAKKLKVEININKATPNIHIDKKIAQIIIQNLLSNAIKYTPDKGKVNVVLKKLGKDQIQLEVTDTGYGIPRNQRHKIFTKLFRADNVVQKDVDGNGLGLYLVKEVVEEIGGSIDFNSQENKGTTFTVKLPIKASLKQRAGKNLSENVQ